MIVSDDALRSASETHPQRIETDYQIGQDNIDAQFGPFKFDVHHPTFPISSLAIIAFVIITLMFQDTLGPLYNHLKVWLSAHLDWFFTSAVNIMLLFCIVLILSPLGKIRLGGANAKPDYSYTGWLSMLFAAGMGPKV